MPEALQSTSVVAIRAYLGGAAMVVLATVVGFAFEGSVLWPYPLTIVLPALWLGELLGNIELVPILIPLLGAVPFLVFGIPLSRQNCQAVWPSLVLCASLIVTSVVYFGIAGGEGIAVQGVADTLFLAFLNVVAASVCAWAAMLAIRRRTLRQRFLAVFLPCLWMVWWALPWLGEMP